MSGSNSGPFGQGPVSAGTRTAFCCTSLARFDTGTCRRDIDINFYRGLDLREVGDFGIAGPNDKSSHVREASKASAGAFPSMAHIPLTIWSRLSILVASAAS